MTITFSTAPQGSEVWHELRRGRITGSKFKDARDKSDGMTDQQRTYVNAVKIGKSPADAMAVAGYKSAPRAEAVAAAIAGNVTMQWSAAATLYARNVARERFGGKAEGIYQTFAMKAGHEQEPFARQAYETTTGHIVHERGFAMTACGMFGLSVDGEVRTDPEGLGGVEIKMMFGSDNLFETVIDSNYSEFMDQCLGALLFLGWQWVDLVLWAPDLEDKGLGLVIHRIHRKDHIDAIAKLQADLDSFAELVRDNEAKLRTAAAENLASMLQAA